MNTEPYLVFLPWIREFVIYCSLLVMTVTVNRPTRAHHFLLAQPLPRSKPNQIYLPRTILPLTYFIHLPMKMEAIVSSETSAIRTQTAGNYPKRNKLHLEHGESLKTRIIYSCFKIFQICTSYYYAGIVRIQKDFGFIGC